MMSGARTWSNSDEVGNIGGVLGSEERGREKPGSSDAQGLQRALAMPINSCETTKRWGDRSPDAEADIPFGLGFILYLRIFLELTGFNEFVLNQCFVQFVVCPNQGLLFCFEGTKSDILGISGLAAHCDYKLPMRQIPRQYIHSDVD